MPQMVFYIEDEKFEFDFSMFIISEKSAEQVQKVISNVSEFQEVVLEPFKPENVQVTKTVAVDEQKEEAEDE